MSLKPAKRSLKTLAPRTASPVTTPTYSLTRLPSMAVVVLTIMLMTSFRPQSGLAGLDYCLRAIRYLQLGEDARDVVTHRFGAEVKSRGDGGVGVALGYER